MKKFILSCLLLFGLLSIALFARETGKPGAAKTVKAAVIGGMTIIVE